MSQNDEKCPLCAQEAYRILTSAPGYQHGTTYSIYECASCLSSFALPLVSDDSLYNLIYANIESVPGYSRYFNYAHEVLKQQNPLAYLSNQEESYWAVASHVTSRKKIDKELKILEVGCGMGYFSFALHKAGFNVTGVDLSPTAVDWARKHYGPFYECKSLQSIKESGEKFDVIVMNQLIEHIPEVHRFIAEALSLLSPKGELLLTTPNKSAYPGVEWETELPPVHLWWLGEEAMNFIARRHGCDIAFIDFTLFYDSHVRVKTPGSSILSRQAVFAENGELLTAQPIPSRSLLRTLLELSGILEVFRKAKIIILKRKRWQGACGPICACVMKPLQVLHE